MAKSDIYGGDGLVEEDHRSNNVAVSSWRIPRPMAQIWEEWLTAEMGEGHIGRLIRCPSGPFGFIRVDGHNPGRIIPEACPIRRDKIPRKDLRWGVIRVD